MKMIYKAPDYTPYNFRFDKKPMVFLAGSIEMGKAEHWQLRAGRFLDNSGFTVLDPRRDDWDSSWIRSIDDENFSTQVKWELKGLKLSDYILMHFDPTTKSPITLLELGLLAEMKPNSLFVSCPDGFWRKGNVEIICDYYKINLSNNLGSALGYLLNKHKNLHIEINPNE